MKHLFKFAGLLATALLILVTPACKKTSSVANCLPVKVQHTGNDTALVTYDAQGRVITYGSINSGLYTFSYNGLTATATTQITDTGYHTNYNISLDAQGRATFINKVVQFTGHTYNYTFSLLYDADGHIIWCEQTFQELGIANTDYYKDSLIYTDGNLTAKYTYSKSSGGVYTLFQRTETTYTNDLNKIGYEVFDYYEEPISVTSGWNAFYHLFGKTSKDLPMLTRTYDSSNTQFYNLSYSFTLNGNGYPTEENIVRSINYPGSKNRKFDYQCN